MKRAEAKPLLIPLFLFALLCSVYLLSFSGELITTDDPFMTGGAQSFVLTGRFSASIDYPTRLDHYRDQSNEFLLPVLAAPLYVAAGALNLGTNHSLFLMTVVLTALAAVLVLRLVQLEGHSPAVALSAALIFALATIAWPYSKSFLRDVPAMLFLLLAVYLWECALIEGTAPLRRALLGALALAACCAGLLSKSALIAALPGLLAAYGLLWASRQWRGGWRARLLIVIGAAGALVTGAAVVLLLAQYARTTALGGLALRFLTTLQSIEQTPATRGAHTNFWPALVGPFISPGKSIFLYSPPLILAPLALRWAGARQARLIWVALAAAVSIAFTNALFFDWLWFQSVGWGLRGMYPAVPLLAAASAPAIAAALHSPRRWPRLALAVVVILGVLVQIGAISVEIGEYYEMIAPLAPQAAWTIALWSPVHSAILGQWQLLLAGRGFNFLWWRVLPLQPGPTLLALALVAACIVAAAAGLWASLRSPAAGRRALLGAAALALFTLTVPAYSLLRAGYEDPSYYGTQADLHAVVDTLHPLVRASDAVLVRAHKHPIWRFFTNYARLASDWYAVADKQDSAGQTILPDSTLHLLQVLPERGTRAWLVNDLNSRGGPARLEERWLAEHYTPLSNQEVTVDNGHVRLSLFSLIPYAEAQRPLQVRFGDDILLLSAQLSAVKVRPGNAVGVRLTWRAARVVTTDYNVGLYLLDAGGQLVAQQDLQPLDAFRPFPTWAPGEAITDTRGVEVPAPAAPGVYTLALAVYNWQDGTRLQVVDGPLFSEGLLSLGQLSVEP